MQQEDNKPVAQTGHDTPENNSQLIYRFLIYLVLFGLVGWYAITSDFMGLDKVVDDAIQDRLYAIYSPSYPTNARDQSLVVLLNDKTIDTLHQSGFFAANEWPITYNDHANVLSSILKYSPAAVFVDVYFKKERSTDDSYPRMKAKLQNYGTNQHIPILFAGGYSNETLTPFQKKISGDFELVTNGWTLPDSHYPLVDKGTKSAAYRLYELMCLKSNPDRACTSPKSFDTKVMRDMSVVWGSQSPVNVLSGKSCQAELRWYDFINPMSLFGETEKSKCPFQNFIYADQLVEIDKHGTAAEKARLSDAIKHKAIFYGTDFTGLHDTVSSPVQGLLPGVFLHAMALDNLMTWGPDYMKASDSFSDLLSYLAWAITSFVIAGIVAVCRNTWVRVSTLVLLLFVFIAVMTLVFHYEPSNTTSYCLGLLTVLETTERLINHSKKISRFIKEKYVSLIQPVKKRITQYFHAKNSVKNQPSSPSTD